MRECERIGFDEHFFKTFKPRGFSSWLGVDESLTMKWFHQRIDRNMEVLDNFHGACRSFSCGRETIIRFQSHIACSESDPHRCLLRWHIFHCPNGDREKSATGYMGNVHLKYSTRFKRTDYIDIEFSFLPIFEDQLKQDIKRDLLPLKLKQP